MSAVSKGRYDDAKTPLKPHTRRNVKNKQLWDPLELDGVVATAMRTFWSPGDVASVFIFSVEGISSDYHSVARASKENPTGVEPSISVWSARIDNYGDLRYAFLDSLRPISFSTFGFFATLQFASMIAPDATSETSYLAWIDMMRDVGAREWSRNSRIAETGRDAGRMTFLPVMEAAMVHSS